MTVPGRRRLYLIKNDFLQNIVQINCIPLLIVIFLLYFLKINYIYEKDLTKKFLPSVALLLALMVMDNIDYYAYDAMTVVGLFDVFHRAAAMLGYDIRIILMASLISVASDRLISNKRAILYTYLPSFINVIFLLPCLFTNLYFYYNEDGTIGRGIFAFEPHILSGLYMIFLFILADICRRKGRRNEMGILALCGTLTIMGFLAEFLFSLRGILIGVVALDITFYYLYLHIEHFRFDALTKIFNRDAFIADIDKYGNGVISHILSIDLNNLKTLNDTYGHNEGDKALKAIADALKASCLPKCFVYRVGGDEFAAICLKKNTDEIEAMIAEMYKAVEGSGYSCAIGYAEWEQGKTFTEVYKDADDRMYRKKRAMKELGLAPMRIK